MSRSVTDLRQVLDAILSMGRGGEIAVVGVCGLAGAGKTTLCKSIVAALPGYAFHLDCDRFSALSLTEREERIALARASGNCAHVNAEENPQNWYDWSGIGAAIDSLRRTRSFEWDRAWNRETGLLDARYSLFLSASGSAVVLCDCIFLLHEPVRAWLDGVIMVQASDEAVALRRRRRARNETAERAARERQARFERPYFERLYACADLIVSL